MRTATPGTGRIFVGLLALVLLFVMMRVPMQGSATGTLDYARQVGYFSAPIESSYTYLLECVADDYSIRGRRATATGIVYPDLVVGGHIFYRSRQSHRGRSVHVGNQKIVDDESREYQDPITSSTFSSSGGWSSSRGPGVAYVIFALWGSPASCTATINGESRPVTYLDGSHAFLVGPEAFTTGVFMQDGYLHAAGARTYTAGLKGGVAFAEMQMGSVGEGSLHYDDRVTRFRECRRPNGGVCGLASPSATTLTATVLAAYDTSGFHGEMIVITLPPDA